MLRMESVSVPGALRGASFSAAEGTIVSLYVEDDDAIEPIALTLSGQRRPDAGRVVVDGADTASLDPAARDRVMALLPEDPRSLLIPRFTVMENMSLAYSYGQGHPLRSAPGRAESALFRAALGEMGMESALDLRADGLSAEHACLLALRMALMALPKALIAVEPRMALNPARSRAYLRAVWRFTRIQPVTTVMITTGADAAKAFGDRCFRVSAGQIIMEPIADGAASLH
ncbi:MAG: hypothetical protein LBK46_02695 [Oscillospiraceae bacterium]|nr:hypothetical protein [Oscillospiraceae bacterium]